MKRFILLLIIGVSFLNTSCSSDDNCVKVARIPQYYLVNNQPFTYNILKEVPCDFIPPYDPVRVDPPLVSNITYEVQDYSYIPDTGHNTSRLSFSLILNNNNDFDIQGITRIKFGIDDLYRYTILYQSNDVTTCPFIEAQSSCRITYYSERPHSSGAYENVTIEGVQYYLTQE